MDRSSPSPSFEGCKERNFSNTSPAIGPAHVDWLRIAGPLTAICGAAQQLREDCSQLLDNASSIIDVNYLEDPKYKLAVDSLAEHRRLNLGEVATFFHSWW